MKSSLFHLVSNVLIVHIDGHGGVREAHWRFNAHTRLDRVPEIGIVSVLWRHVTARRLRLRAGGVMRRRRHGGAFVKKGWTDWYGDAGS